MSLNLVAFKHIRKLENVVADEKGKPRRTDTGKRCREACFQALVHEDYPQRAADLEDQGFYTFSSMLYAASVPPSVYLRWREQLAAFAGYRLLRDRQAKEGRSHLAGARAVQAGPFWELLNFADREGVIGAHVSAKLAQDFLAHQDLAAAHPQKSFRDMYTWLQRAFTMASDQGAVSFN